MRVKIFKESFNPWEEIQQFQKEFDSMSGQYGATNAFVGTMRDFNVGDNVKAMRLEYYPEMTEKQLSIIVNEAMLKWRIIDVLLVHRVGNIFPDETIVLVAVWSSHRGDAFDGGRYIMEALKSKAPFWKKEILVSNKERWVNANSDGYSKG